MGDAKFAIPKLNGANWHSWKVRVEMLLAREDLWHVVEDDIPAEEEMSEQWKSEDRKARSTIILLLEDGQLSKVRNCVHAKDAYNALRNHHQKTTRSVRVSLLKKICSTNLSDNGDVEKHLQEFDGIFERLDGAGMRLDKDTKICMLLRSLPACFDGLITALDSRTDDDISLEVVKSKLVDEYNRQLERKGGSTRVERAMRSDVRYWNGRPEKDTRTCHYCKKTH